MNFYLQAHDDCVNSVVTSFKGENTYMLTSSGQRLFNLPPNLISNEDSSSSSESGDEITESQNPSKLIENNLKFWRIE